MKVFSKLVATGLVTIAMAAFNIAPALADSPGQLEGGTGILLAKNISQGGSYSDSTQANACDEVQYSARLHNVAFGGLTDVKVSVTLPSASATSNTATMVATTNLGGTSGTSDITTVNFASAQTLSYESGTTTLYDGNGNIIKTLPDTITTSGVDIGALNGSTTEFVNFKAKVSCPTPPSVFTATATATASATASATATCPPGQGGASATVSATGTATATANATSNVSQADADQKAQDAAAQAAMPNAQANAQANANAKAQASVKCSAAVVTAVSTPTVNKTLPNTGPGDVAGAFVGASTLGTAAHAFFTRRRRQ